MPTEHEQMLVKVDGQQALIDRGIAPLIEELWKADIDTYNSCEENQPGIMWIQFATVRDGERFLNIVTRYAEGSECLYNRITQYWSSDEATEERFWDYHALPSDFHLDEVFDDDEGTVEVSHPGRPFIRLFRKLGFL